MSYANFTLAKNGGGVCASLNSRSYVKKVSTMTEKSYREFGTRLEN